MLGLEHSTLRQDRFFSPGSFILDSPAFCNHTGRLGSPLLCRFSLTKGEVECSRIPPDVWPLDIKGVLLSLSKSSAQDQLLLWLPLEYQASPGEQGLRSSCAEWNWRLRKSSWRSSRVADICPLHSLAPGFRLLCWGRELNICHTLEDRA